MSTSDPGGTEEMSDDHTRHRHAGAEKPILDRLEEMNRTAELGGGH